MLLVLACRFGTLKNKDAAVPLLLHTYFPKAPPLFFFLPTNTGHTFLTTTAQPMKQKGGHFVLTPERVYSPFQLFSSGSEASDPEFVLQLSNFATWCHESGLEPKTLPVPAQSPTDSAAAPFRVPKCPQISLTCLFLVCPHMCSMWAAMW